MPAPSIAGTRHGQPEDCSSNATSVLKRDTTSSEHLSCEPRYAACPPLEILCLHPCTQLVKNVPALSPQVRRRSRPSFHRCYVRWVPVGIPVPPAGARPPEAATGVVALELLGWSRWPISLSIFRSRCGQLEGAPATDNVSSDQRCHGAAG